MITRLLDCTGCMASIADQNWNWSWVMWVCVVISRSQRHLISHRLYIQPSRGILVFENRLRLRWLQPRCRVGSCRLLLILLHHKLLLLHPRCRIRIGIIFRTDLSEVEFSVRASGLVGSLLRQFLHILATDQIVLAVGMVVLLGDRADLASDITSIEVPGVTLRRRSGCSHSPTLTAYLCKLLLFKGLDAMCA